MSELRESFPLADVLGFGIRTKARAALTDTLAPAQSTKSGSQWSRHYRMMLSVTDAMLIVLAVVVTGGILSWSGFAAGPTAPDLLFSATACVLWVAMLFCFRTRDARVIGVGAGEYKRVVHSCAATAGWLAVLALFGDTDAARTLLLLTIPAGAAALVGSRWCWRRWLYSQRKAGHYLSRVLVLGAEEDVRYVIRQIDRKSGAAYDVVGAVLESRAGAESINIGSRAVPLIGGLDDVPAAVRGAGADAVIVAGHLNRGSRYVRELGWKLEASATELVLASALTNVAGPRIQMRPVEGLPLMHVELPTFTGARHIFKRLVDIAAALAALLMLAPLMVVLAGAIRRDSPGGAFFSQQRVGRKGELFRMYKFRSMVQSAEDELAQLARHNEGAGPLFKLRNDPRVTGVGVWLRRYSLDELPQFINVLRGDMSLVGPRPPLPNEVADYRGHVHRRLFIKPGITGLWQINGRSDLDWEESVRLDLYYVENWSLTGDLMIMWRTFKVMLRPSGAY